jgi:hypothetical protein
MSEDKKSEAFLSRWSRLKRDAENAPPVADALVAPLPTPGGQSEQVEPAPLPPIESISVESDITPYLQAKVNEGLKRMALKKLFQDSHFHFANMDKLDIYIDDYSIADPLPESMLKELKFAQDYIFKDPTQPAPEDPHALAKPEEGVSVGGFGKDEVGAALPPAPTLDEQPDKMSQSAVSPVVHVQDDKN